MGWFSPKVKQKQEVGKVEGGSKEDGSEEVKEELEEEEEVDTDYEGAITMGDNFAMLDVGSDYSIEATLKALGELAGKGFDIVSSIDGYLILKKRS